MDAVEVSGIKRTPHGLIEGLLIQNGQIKVSKKMDIFPWKMYLVFGSVHVFSRTPDRDFRCFYPCEIFLSHIPTHMRSSDPYVSSLLEKSVPHRYPRKISVTNTNKPHAAGC